MNSVSDGAPFLRRIRLGGLLSFAPDSPPFELGRLNVLIGPNASGKSNFLEGVELLKAAPEDFAAAVRLGGGAPEWLWKGPGGGGPAELDAVVGPVAGTDRLLRYRLDFVADRWGRVEVFDEAIEAPEPRPGETDPYFYYRFQRGHPALNVSETAEGSGRRQRRLRREDLQPDQSVLAQRRDPDTYPELAWLAGQFRSIQSFREWSFGRTAPMRTARRADLPSDRLTSDAENLALMVDQLDHHDPARLNGLVKQFFPRFERISTKVSGGRVECFFHEADFTSPVPATRVADGAIRFVAVLACLLAPSPPTVLCLEAPELGLHPDTAAMFADLLIEASERMQIIATTHSEALVGALSGEADSVVVCERPADGTILRRLDAAEVSERMDENTLGDLWRIGALGGNHLKRLSAPERPDRVVPNCGNH